MKALKSLLFIGLIAAASACNDDDDTTSTNALDDAEAAEIIAASVAESSSGLTVVVDESAMKTSAVLDDLSGGRVQECGYSDSESFSTASTPGSSVTYSYSYTYNYDLTCGLGDAPQTMNASVTYDGEFDGPRMSSSHDGTATLALSELDESANTYTVNGTYGSEGSFVSKIRNKNSSNSLVSIALEDITVDKTDSKITGGGASATLSGSTPGKGDFLFTASIVFNGDDTATVTIKGTVYTVNLITGTVE